MSQMTLTLAFVGIAVILLLRNTWRADIVALILMLALGLSGVLTAQEAFSGFSRSAVVIMFSAFVLAEGLRRSGATERIGNFIIRLFGQGEKRLIFGVMAAAALLSLFMNNIAAASLLFPALSGVARRSKVSLSRLLMPLAFGTILGGMATLLTTVNVVVGGLLRDSRLQGFGLTEFLPMGLPLTLAGILYMVFWGRKMLPEQSVAQRHEQSQLPADLLETYQVSERLVKARLCQGGCLEDVALANSGLRDKYHLNVLGIQRAGQSVPVASSTVLRGGDILLMLARPEDTIPDSVKDMLELLPADGWQEHYLATPNLMLIESAIAPRSALAGQTLRDLRFEQKFQSKVLAVWRHGRSIRTRLAELRLEFGDGLLLQASERSLDLLRTEPGLTTLAESSPSAFLGWRSWITVLIMLVTLGAAAILPLLIAEIMVTGAIAMVLVGTLTMDQAYRAVDWRSLFLVAAMLPVAVALNKTGASTFFANGMLLLFRDAGPVTVLAGFVFLTVALTQVVNGVAAVAIIAPVAIVASRQLGLDPRAVALGVALAGSMAFMSPLGHSVNVLVMGAGGYSFKDYARVGIPLTALLILLVVIGLPIVMPLVK